MANKLVKTSTTYAWDAGATSSSTRGADLVASFTLGGASVGIIAGLAPAGSLPSYASVEHGFLAQDGLPLQIIESGSVAASFLETFTADTQAQIYRVGTSVYYVVGDQAYSSGKPSSGAKALQAVLYAPGDYLDEPVIAVYAPDISNVGMVSTLSLSDSFGYEEILYGSLESVLTLSSSASGYLLVGAGMESTLVLLDIFGAELNIVAGLQSVIRLSSEAGAASLAVHQYATNLMTGAVTRYADFEFDGFCRVGMDTFAYRQDGLYKLTGSDDDGKAIHMLIRFGEEDLGSTQAKRVGNIFMGLETDGDIQVQMTGDDGRDARYRAYRRRSEYRADLARGIKSRFWEMQVEITHATHAQLDNIEWVVSANGRRT